ncbi:MAG: hypothetical protein FJ044_04525 [Candidatus Cloacimonetes bacterium]|nr:hypothetical protein [Candidatus Cloacimonadota bacterium]
MLSKLSKYKLPFTIYGLLITFFVFGVYFGFKKLTVSSRRIEISKGLVGQPRLLNPLYAALNPVDAEISKLLFRGLVSYNEKGEIVGDLAESWEVSEDGKVYTFKLKPHLSWHNEEKFRADDVVFSIRLTQEEGYEGPEKGSFTEVTVEKIDEQTIKFILKEPFAPFLDRLTLGILPKHELFAVAVTDLPKDEFNLNPIGTGEWQFAGLKVNSPNGRINSLKLELRNRNTEKLKNKTTLLLNFYEDEEDLVTAFKLGEINTFTTINPNKIAEFDNWPNVKISSAIKKDISFALFFNLQGKEILQNSNFRKSLAYAINKNELPGEAINGPIPPSSWAYFPDVSKYSFDQEKAKGLLAQFSEEESARRELNLKFCEKTFCQELADRIAKDWQEVGIKANLEKLSKNELAEIIKNRNFEILLLEQNLGKDPDQYGLWHSSQIEPPGQNITGFNNRRIDKFLTDARKALGKEERKTAYQEIQKEIASELPAIFLIQPELYQISRGTPI